jgi:hypothetical protein
MKTTFLKFVFYWSNHLSLYLCTIEKRKASIKNKLLKDKGSDKELIEQAIKGGLL